MHVCDPLCIGHIRVSATVHGQPGRHGETLADGGGEISVACGEVVTSGAKGRVSF